MARRRAHACSRRTNPQQQPWRTRRHRRRPPPLRRASSSLLPGTRIRPLLDPAARGTAAQALQSDFFTTPPLPCDLSALLVVYKEEPQDLTTCRDGRKPKQRHRRKDNMLKTEEQQQAEEPKNNSGLPDNQAW